jgi:hypothetical protein
MSDYIKTFELKSVGSVEAANWVAWSKQQHSPRQSIDELVDNAIAAIQAGVSGSGKVYVRLTFDTHTGYIEHSGGTTFPTDEGIIRCLTYGGQNPTLLNEHGCGLKTSLAILDPENKGWKIFIKRTESGVLKFYRISAPYSNQMSISRVTAWPGEDKSAEPGSLIQFPITQSLFKGFFKTGTKMDNKDKEIGVRFKNHLAHMWQCVEKILNGDIQLFYNGEKVTPFSFRNPDVLDYVDVYRSKKVYPLSAGGKAEIVEIKLKDIARSIPGSNIFKYGLQAIGTYIFKNGRCIEAINNDDARNLFTAIYGQRPHNSLNGIIHIINLVGQQDVLPATVPTKNRFVDSPLFDEVVTLISNNITKMWIVEDDRCEGEIRDTFKAKRERMMRSAGIVGYSIEKGRGVSLGGIYGPPMDLFEKNGSKYTVMEFKKNIRPTVQDFHQLLGYWTYAREAYPDKDMHASLYLAPSTDFQMTSENKALLHVLSKEYNFCPKIYDYEDNLLYRQDPVV